jgi:hypothetical protein
MNRVGKGLGAGWRLKGMHTPKPKWTRSPLIAGHCRFDVVELNRLWLDQNSRARQKMCIVEKEFHDGASQFSSRRIMKLVYQAECFQNTCNWDSSQSIWSAYVDPVCPIIITSCTGFPTVHALTSVQPRTSSLYYLSVSLTKDEPANRKYVNVGNLGEWCVWIHPSFPPEGGCTAWSKGHR